MCIGIPAEVTEIGEPEGVSRPAIARRADGVEAVVDLAMLQEISEGDFVIVHSGYAVSRLTEAEATSAIDLLKKGGLVM